MLLHDFVEDWAARTPDATALIEPGRQASYDQLNRLANRFAGLYRGAGVGRGDRVVVALDNGINAVAAYLGAMKAGAAAVPLPAGPRSDRLASAIADCAPRVCIVDSATARSATAVAALVGVPSVYGTSGPGTTPLASLEDALELCSDEFAEVGTVDQDLAAIIYTSGSTGEPRGVMLTHRNFVANARSIVSYLGLTALDRVMCVLPLHYVYGLSLLHTHLMVGGSVVIDNRFTFPNVVLAAMQQHRVTGFAGVPSTFAILLHRSSLRDVSLPDLRYVTQAGGSMPPTRILEWLDRGPRADFYVMYGATEAAARLTYLAPSELRSRLGAIGRPVPNVDICVITETGERAKPGDVGELVASGENISPGYWNNPEATRERFDTIGYRTGDLGYADEDGYLYLVGRLHDMIKVGAHRVGAREIEDVLCAHPAVHESAVVAAPHHLLGEVPVAFVALARDVEVAPETLRRFCGERLPAHKVPAYFVVKDDLPKIPGIGKIDRRALRDEAASAAVREEQAMTDGVRSSAPSRSRGAGA